RVGNPRCQMSQFTAAGNEPQPRAGFTGGAAGNVEIHQQLGGSPALESLGDVIGNRKSGSLQLVADIPQRGEGAIVDQIEDRMAKSDRRLPYGEILEAI